MTQLREFLRHQFIGAIVIGLLAYQGLAALITAAISPIVIFISSPSGRSAFGYDKPAFPWNQLLPNVLHGVLALALAYVLLRWLYGTKEPIAMEPAETSE